MKHRWRHHHGDGGPRDSTRHSMRYSMRHYMRARLHRRLFFWLTAAIVLSAGVFFAGFHLTHGRVLPPVGAAFLVLWLAAGGLAYRIMRPLAALAQVARDIGDGKLQSRARLRRNEAGEAGILAEAINDMAQKIEKQMSQQRELLAAVSHELRTPLTRMRVLSELIANRNDPNHLQQLESEINEMDTLVGDLLASARLDFSALRVRPQMPAALAARALERAGEPGSVLTDEGAPEVMVDPTLVLRALANLLDNAKKHGGGVTALRVRTRAGRTAFEVEDKGKGFSEQAVKRLFQPFTGGDNETSSLGLGLALVRRIAEAHKGTAYAENLPTGGAKVGFEVAS